MTQNETELKATSYLETGAASGSTSSKGFCIDAILNDANRQQESRELAMARARANELAKGPPEWAALAGRGHSRRQQQHQQHHSPQAWLADYYQHHYQAGSQLAEQRQQALEEQQLQSQPQGNQATATAAAAAAAAAAATALANSVAMRQLQSFMANQQQSAVGQQCLAAPAQVHGSSLGQVLFAVSAGQQQQQQQQQQQHELGQSAQTPPERQSSTNSDQSALSASSSDTPPQACTRGFESAQGQAAVPTAATHQHGAFGHAGLVPALNSFPLDWLAKASFLYGQQQHQTAHESAHQNHHHQQQQHQFGPQHTHQAGHFEAGACPRDQPDYKGCQQRQASPGFVQPIRHHVVMSPNTIASAAFAGKWQL